MGGLVAETRKRGRFRTSLARRANKSAHRTEMDRPVDWADVLRGPTAGGFGVAASNCGVSGSHRHVDAANTSALVGLFWGIVHLRMRADLTCLRDQNRLDYGDLTTFPDSTG